MLRGDESAEADAPALPVPRSQASAKLLVAENAVKRVVATPEHGYLYQQLVDEDE
jgi:hypothetical protein